MKNIKFLLGLFSVVIIMASCATMGAAGGDDMMNDPRARQMGNRVYMDDPYYGTVILERDPYTGRYYDVTPGVRYGAGYYRGYPYGSMHRGGVVRGNNRSYGGEGNVIRKQAPSREQIQQNRASTRSRILGN